MTIKESLRLRLERRRLRSVNVQSPGQPDPDVRENAVVDCGWGRLVFAQTFADPALMVATLCEEQPNRRDIALYVSDPHVAVSLAPQEVFLDPSHTFRLWLDRYRPAQAQSKGFTVRLLNSPEDTEAVHNL